jgi:hypothetical protein
MFDGVGRNGDSQDLGPTAAVGKEWAECSEVQTSDLSEALGPNNVPLPLPTLATYNKAMMKRAAARIPSCMT